MLKRGEQKKEPKKTERTFAGREGYDRDGASNKPVYGKDGQVGKTFNKFKKNVP